MGKSKSDAKAKGSSKETAEASGDVEAAEPRPTEGAATQLTRRYTDALDMARIIHGSQVRKGTTIPYLAHLMDVSSIVLEYGGTEDEAIAGLLHDAAEDGGGARRLEAIRAEFGDEVAAIVHGLSDSLAEDPNSKAPWIERKQAYLSRLATEPPAVLLVCAADKLANLTSTRADYRRLGPELWKRFNAPRAAQLWYTEQTSRVFTEQLRTGRPADLAAELAAQLEEFQDEVRDREGVKRRTLIAEFDDFIKHCEQAE